MTTSKKRKKKTEPLVVAGEPRNLAVRVRAEAWPIARIKPYPRNAKEHPQEQVDLIRASYRRFGEVGPLVVSDDGEIIAGHGRHLALSQENVSDVRVLVAIDWSEEEQRAYRLLDNQSNMITGYDKSALKGELADMRGMGIDISGLGFGEDELARLLHQDKAGLTDPDDVPDPPIVPCSRRGDVWLLADRHRITCGDSTNPDDVARVLGSRRPHLMVTDPPYGVEYRPAWRDEQMLGPGKGKRATGQVLNDDRADWQEAWELFPGDVAYIWHAGKFCGVVANSLEAAGFVVRQQIVWNKQRQVIGRSDYHFKHEPCFYAVREGADEHWQPEHEVATYTTREGKSAQFDRDGPMGRKQSTVWNIEHVKSETGHGTQKPVECMRRPIENNSVPGDGVYEPFSGSGTTILAAEVSDRRCYAIELNPPYVDIAVKRWEAFTGLSAKLEGDGRSFAEIAGLRAADLERSAA